MVKVEAALAALILATTATAQTRVSVVDGQFSPVTAAAGGRALSGNPTNVVGTLPSGLSLSALSSVLPAPSVNPLKAVSVQAQTKVTGVHAQAVPAALTPSAVVLGPASKADDIKREAAEAVAAWRAKQAGNAPSAKAPSPDVPVDALDSFFDGSLPSSREVLSRAAKKGLTPAALGLAVAESKTTAEAASRLRALGALGNQEAALSESDPENFRFLLTRLWREASPSIPGEFSVDKTWGVDALKVERGGVTYYVHAVAHGRHVAPRRGAVLAMAAKLEKAGRALYSEQNLPAYYGYTTGKETLDHRAPDGYPTTVVAAAPGWSKPGLVFKNLLDRLIAPGSAIAAAVWAAVQPANALSWLALAAALLLSFTMLTSGIVVRRWRHLSRAADARKNGWDDIAAQYADEARWFFTAKPDLEAIRSLELPQPLASSADPYSIRSRAIADAVAADAAAAGASEAHLVVGHLHAHEVAWRLKHGPRPDGAGAQIS